LTTFNHIRGRSPRGGKKKVTYVGVFEKINGAVTYFFLSPLNASQVILVAVNHLLLMVCRQPRHGVGMVTAGLCAPALPLSPVLAWRIFGPGPQTRRRVACPPCPYMLRARYGKIGGSECRCKISALFDQSLYHNSRLLYPKVGCAKAFVLS
jgi:hypothetical protein